MNTFDTDALNEIYCKLTCEDQTLRTFRRALGSGQYVQTDLIPFLINVKDPKLVDMMIRILVNLTMPVECLFSTKVMMRTEIGRHTVSDLTALLTSCKESFTDARATRAVVEHMKNVFDKGNKLMFEHCDSINNCLLLLRNILHIPENAGQNASERKNHSVSMQNKIIWHLFMMSIDKLLLFLMSCSQRDYWSVTMVQLISVMYKDQQASFFFLLLKYWDFYPLWRCCSYFIEHFIRNVDKFYSVYTNTKHSLTGEYIAKVAQCLAGRRAFG